MYIYILKSHYKEIEKSILHKRMMVKKKNENLKSPYISILTLLKRIIILFYPDYHCHNTQKYFRVTQ